ncbi:MAG: hypothetical protein NDJ89_08620 [Oligoflexia bacterium]|nr:hypothetical protein [Oligoflexia bacterium]
MSTLAPNSVHQKIRSSFRIALIVAFFTVFLPIFAEQAQARPEYAGKNGIVNCGSCHVSPSGAGIRNVNGKLYQTRNLGPSGTSMIDWFQGDARFIGIIPQNPKGEGRSSGIVLMSTILSGHAPIARNAESGSETSFVVSYDLGFLNANKIRDAFLLYRPIPVEDTGWVSGIMFGRYQVIPFGLLTDEHRTYVRGLTKTTFHQDQEFGLGVSGDPFYNLHYDAMLLNGEASAAGSAFGTRAAALSYGMLFNIRYNPLLVPGFVGMSYRSYKVVDAAYSPWAGSLYGAISGAKLTRGLVKATLLGELVMAHGYNDSGILSNGSISNNFTGGNTALKDAIKDSVSQGYYVELDYDLTNRWTLMYKFDYVALDRHFTADAFYRHAFGFRFAVNSAASFWARYEMGEAKRVFFTNENSKAERDDLLLVLHVSI